MGTTTIERYTVTKTHHCGPIERDLREGATVDITPDYLAVDGQRITGHRAAIAAETVRVMWSRKNGFFDKVGELEQEVPDDVGGSPRPLTQTLAVWPILGCLKAAEEFVGGIDKWKQVNEAQTEFFEQFSDHINDVDLLGDYLRRMANSDYKVINQWLKDNNFHIEVGDPGPGGFAVGSILDVMVEWLKKGSRRKVDTLKGSFSAVLLKEGVSLRQHPEVSKHPVVRIATQSGVRVCMAIVDDIPEGRYGLLSRIRSLSAVEAQDYRFEGVIFPMVHYDRDEDISYMCGLECHTEKKGMWFVSDAVQQTRFRMNEVGARAESAVAMSFSRGISADKKKPYVIDRPFVLWMEHEALPMPLFAGLFAEDVWKDPKGLE